MFIPIIYKALRLSLDAEGDIIYYEEYHPYGTTSYQAKSTAINALAKRYRYTGKERDEESGLYYHGARYYIPWLGRWTAVDPLESKYAGMSPYNYSFNNPVRYNDPSGADPQDLKKTVPKPKTTHAPSPSKPKVDIPEPLKKEIEKSVEHEAGEAAKDVERILVKRAEKKVAEQAAKEVEKGIFKKIVIGAGHIGGGFIDAIFQIFTPVDAIPGAGDMHQYKQAAAEQEKIKTEFAEASN